MKAYLPIVLLLFISLSGRAQTTLDPTTDKILYTIATAHLDDQWNWTIQDTINSYIPKTLNQNFTLFQDYPHYVFSFEEAWRYQLIHEYYPADFVTLSNYVEQGRWRLTGSAMVAGDMNVPSPESLIRQTLYANTYWRHTFGQTTEDIFLPDCFGFCYALPSVAAHCGLKGFSSQKLSWGSAIPLPFQNIGRWIGPDGASVVAVLQPGAYTGTITDNLANNSTYYSRITNMHAATGLYIDYRYFGTGDTGGSPDTSSVGWLEQSVTTTNGLINVLSTGADQLFRDLTPAQVSQLPSYQGELLMKTHGTGCYTSHPENKRYNRQNEQRADAAERVAVMADWLQGGGTYPQEKLNAAWARFLWHQFHDDLTGTSIPSAYPFSWNDYLLSLNEFASVEEHSVGVLAKGLDTRVQGVPLVVYNPLAWTREDIVEARVIFTNGVPPAVRVFDANGNEVPSQMGMAVGSTATVTFLAEVPSAGAAVYDVRPAASPSSMGTGLSVSTSQLESPRYRVQLNANGDVSSILDKVNNRELLHAPIRWDFLNNLSTAWPAWEVMFSDVTAAPLSYLGGPATVEIVEDGPARVGLSVTRANAGSVITERISLAAGSAGDTVAWDVSANWASLKTLLKVEFPLGATNAAATYDLGLGTIQRTNNTANLYEVPAQQWADLTSSNGTYGVTIMNDCRYGWDKPNDSTLRMTVFHTPAVGGSYVYQATNGFGTHRLGFGLMGHTNDWRSGGSAWAAARFNQPLQAFQTTMHEGPLGTSFEFLSCNNPNVMVKAIKKAEDSNEIIVRLQELTGQTQAVQLSFAAPITAARQVTGAEDPINPLSPVGGNLTVSLGAYQPLALALTLAAPGTSVTPPMSVPVALPYNLDAISTDNDKTDGNFDGGYTYPAELVPPALVREGVHFVLGPTADGALNAVACQGQTIPLAPGYDRLYLLAAAASNDVDAVFSFAGQETNLTIRYFSGFIGQWNPPFLKKDAVGLICTHRHTGAGANDAYRFCYLFKYCLNLPPGASSLTLPNLPNVRLFAVSLATNTTAETTAAGGSLAHNELPWANAGPDQWANGPASNSTATVTLDASGSSDPDGIIVNYAWTLDGTPLATGVKPVVDLPFGTNVIALTVTDNEGGTGRASLSVIVLPALEVLLTAFPSNAASAPLQVQFTAQASGGNVGAAADTTDDNSGTVSAQGENTPNETAVKAFDNSTSTKWLDFANAQSSTRSSWIQYQYAGGAQLVVTNYTITSANDSPERDPATWRLLGSKDGGANWTTLDVRSNQVFTARFQKQGFATTNLAAFNLYRLQIDRVANPASANSVQLSEIEFIGSPAYSYQWSFGDGATSTTQNPQHTYTSVGNYRVALGARYGIYTGTSAAVISIGSQLTASLSAMPNLGPAPMTVQFNALAGGGNGARTPYSATSDGYGIISAQGENAPGEAALKAFDNTTSTKWLDFAYADPSTRSSWLQYQLADDAQFVVSQYALSSANDATTYPERNPASWRLLGSSDGGAAWTVLDIQSNETFTANYQTLAYPIANTNPYNVYRLAIDSVANPAAANSVQLSELQLIGLPAYSYLWTFGDGASSTERNPLHNYANTGTYLVTLAISDGVATTVTNTTVEVLPLYLSVSQPVSGQVSFSWPVWGSNCSLYMTTNLVAPVLWTPTTNAVISQGGTNSVSIVIGPGNRFFQLRSP